MKLNNKDAANRLGVHHTTLNMWRSIGRPFIPYYRLGGKIVYESQDIDDYLDKHKVSEDPGKGGAL